MTGSSRTGSDRHYPYLADQVSARFHRTPAGIAWRWRTEITTLAALAYALIRLAAITSYPIAAAIIGGTIAVLLLVPLTRRLIAWRCWCLLARHRLHRLCWESRLHTRGGRIPLVIWIRPTRIGERAILLCRAGTCADDFQQHIGELSAACWARDCRVTRHPRWSQVVTIDIIRRDVLAAGKTISSPLPGHARPPGGDPGQELIPLAGPVSPRP
jgi:hypothetical protein